MNIESTCCHFREIENLIDQMPEMIRGSLDSLYRLDLPRTEISVNTLAKKVDESHYRIKRSSQLMRNVSEKVIFHTICTKQFG
jgi:hypothetical protein